MKTSITSVLKIALLLLFSISPSVLAQQISWPVKIVPAGSSVVKWSTTSPVQSGTLVASEKITFNQNSNINFEFIANPGFKLIHVYKNTEDKIAWVNAHAGKDSFGPVQKSHTITAICELLNPTGTFAGTYADGKDVTTIADVTGNYKGTATVKNTPRAYDADVAMDDSGKLSALGTVDGLANASGGAQISGSAGSVKTVDDKPYADLKGSFKGSVDGKPATGSGSASGDLVFETAGGKTQLTGEASGSAVKDGTKSSAKPTAGSIDVPAGDVSKLKKAWGLSLTLVEKTPLTGKKYVEASGTLRLSNGEFSKFLPKKVTYSEKKGYAITFTSGQKLDTLGKAVYLKDPKTGANKLDSKGNPIPVIDKKSSVKISSMILNQTGATWTPVSGGMQYKFLGQKGAGDLISLLD